MTTSIQMSFEPGGSHATRTWEPAVRSGRGRFLLLHGMESHSAWFEAVGAAIAAQGFPATAYDRSGWGESAGVRGDLAATETLFGELTAARVALIKSGEPCHLAGLSWGGLPAALTTATSVTLIAPALFPRRRVKLGDYLKIAARTGTVALPLKTQDFTAIPRQQAFVAGDALRIQRVSARFLRATWDLQRAARARPATAAVRTILLAGKDTLIDNGRTAVFARVHGYNVATLAGAAHSLVLEDPDWVATQMVAAARRAEAAL